MSPPVPRLGVMSHDGYLTFRRIMDTFALTREAGKDWHTMVVPVVPYGRDHTMALVAPMEMPRERALQIAVAVAAVVQDNDPPPTEMVLVSDSYMSVYPIKAGARTRAEIEEGIDVLPSDKPDAVEAALLVYSRKGPEGPEVYWSWIAYHYGPGGITWDPPQPWREPVEGGRDMMHAAMLAAFDPDLHAPKVTNFILDEADVRLVAATFESTPP